MHRPSDRVAPRHGRPRGRTARAAAVALVCALGGGAVAHAVVPDAAPPALADPVPPTAPVAATAAVPPAPAAGAATPTAGASLSRSLGPAVPAPPRIPQLADVTLDPPARVAPPAPAPTLDLTSRSTSDPASLWVVVNKSLPLNPRDYAPAQLAPVQGYQVRPEVQQPLSDLLAAAAADGVGVAVRSAYRSYARQVDVHDGWAAQVGAARADEVSARAGHSEHQTGLAVDVGSTADPACDFQDCFATTPEGMWVAANAGRFGFVLRYTELNRPATGFAPEGWHLRYVGVDLVQEMQRRQVTSLEELFGLPGGATYP